MRRALPIALAALAAACEPEPPPPVTPAQPTPETAASTPTGASAAEPQPRLDAIPRLDFNRIAAELDLPLFWIADTHHTGAIEPDTLAVLWGVAPGGPFTGGDRFTPAFLTAYAAMAKVKAEGYPMAGLSEPERKRR